MISFPFIRLVFESNIEKIRGVISVVHIIQLQKYINISICSRYNYYFSTVSLANFNNNCFCPTFVKNTVAFLFPPRPSTASTFPFPKR